MKKSIFLLSFLAFFLTQEGYCEDCPVTKHCSAYPFDVTCYCPVKINETECIKLETNEKIKCLENKADKGDVEAMFFLGAIYKYDLHQDKKATKWFKKAGDGRSFYEIGEIHCSRARIESNNSFINHQYKPFYNEKNELIKCDKWYDKAAQLGHEMAATFLAAIAKSETLREKWSIELAKKGDCMRLFMLADDYEKGSLVKQDPQKAAQLYIQAADLECPKKFLKRFTKH